MFRLAAKIFVCGVGGVALLYTFFFVPVGRRTLFEHVARIAATEEAQELGDEVGEAGAEFGNRVRERVVDAQ